MALWKKIEFSTLDDPPALLGPDDICYYARDYVSGGSWNASEANQLIRNLKKDPSKRNTLEWNHKLRAVNKFAAELSSILPPGQAFAFIPTSKRHDDAQYDSRWEMVKDELSRIRPDLIAKRPILRETSCVAVHQGGKRKRTEIRATLGWRGFKDVPGSLVLIDDVITAGAHFKVCKGMIHEVHLALPVFGVFWARTIWPEDEPCPPAN
jgi:hypothetical protein